jgi:hypothetical protein
VLQGRYITHIALPSTNCRERITMVTSFRPKDPFAPDESVLTTVRPVSDLNELYNQWTEYRVEIVEERCRRLVKKIRGNKRVGRNFDIAGVKAEIGELQAFLDRTAGEIVEKSNEIVEETEEEDGERSKKRSRRN